MAEARIPQPAPRLPYCIPTTYTDAAGRACLAYPRSAWDPQRYLVHRFAPSGMPAATDLECVHDDFGHLVPLRERALTADWASALAWQPVVARAAA